jgi:autotransporter-associated beta strand protein
VDNVLTNALMDAQSSWGTNPQRPNDLEWAMMEDMGWLVNKVWTNGGQDLLWGANRNVFSNPPPASIGNWAPGGEPMPQDLVTFTDQGLNDGDVINLSDPLFGNAARYAYSLTFNTVRTFTITYTVAGYGSLTLVSGNITRTAGSAGIQTITAPLVLGASGIWDISGAGELRIAGSVQEAAPGLGIDKRGPGTVVLGGDAGDAAANTYSGTTIVRDGTVVLNKQFGTNAIGGNLVLSGGSVRLNQGEQIPDTAAVTLSAGTLDFNNQVEGIGSLDFQGGTISNFPAATALRLYSSLYSTGTALSMRNTTIPFGISLQGAPGLTGTVVFDATNNGTAMLSGGLELGGTATTWAFNIADGTAPIDMQITGLIFGFGGLTKVGNGTLVIGGGPSDAAANNFTGATIAAQGTLLLNKQAGTNAIGGDLVVSGGSVVLQQAQQIPDAASVTVAAGTLNFNNRAETIGSLNFQGGTISNVASTLPLTSTATALTMRNTTIPFGISLQGASGGGVTFDATNSGTATIAGPLNMGNATRNFNVDDGTDDVDMRVSGPISGSVGCGLTKVGNGTLVLGGGASDTAANNYGGTTTVAQGTLVLDKRPLFNAIGGDLVLTGGSVLLQQAEQIPNAAVTVSAGTLDFNNQTETIGSLNFQGGAIANVSYKLHLTSTATALTMRNTTIAFRIALQGASGGGVTFDAFNNGTATIAGPVYLGNATRTFNAGDGADDVDMRVSGPISESGGLTKTGYGTLTLGGGPGDTAANTYGGATTVQQGVLILSKATATNAIGGNLIMSGGDVTLEQAEQIPDTASVTLAEGVLALNYDGETIGSLDYLGGIVVGNLPPLVLTSTGTALTMHGNDLWLSLAFSGISGGQVTYDPNSGSPVTLFGSLDLGNVTRTFNIGGGTQPRPCDMRISGAVSGEGGLTKTGSGTLALVGGHTYQGDTTVAQGRLLLAPEASTSVDVGANATLTIEPGAAVILAGAKSALSDAADYVDVINDSGAVGTGLLVTGSTTQEVGAVSGTGRTTVGDGSSASTLIADSIVQDTLVIGAGSAMIIAESPRAAGAALPLGTQGGGAPSVVVSGGGAPAVPEPAAIALLLAGSVVMLVRKGGRTYSVALSGLVHFRLVSGNQYGP